MFSALSKQFKSLFSNKNSTILVGESPILSTEKATRRFVISDIHGCPKTLSNLIQQLKLSKTDYLFFLGDFIDKGIDSEGVLDFVIQLIEDSYQVFPLRGNHENDLLESCSYERILLKTVRTNRLENLFERNLRELKPKYSDFLNSLPYYYELDDYYLVHAGFDFKSETPFQKSEEMLWIRDFEYSENKAKGKTIIHGHTPTSLSEIKSAIKDNQKVICLDNGAVFYDFETDGLGKLLCLDLDTSQIYEQDNLERERL
ncbi:MAG: serine/threonine protein phosphatase 1 [Arenicella sp.]|jgi:serine/threonine protein phosphatase 1